MDEGSFDPASRPEYYEMVLDALPDAVLTISRDSVITGFNRAAEQLCGLVRGQAIGRPCREIFHAAVCDHIAECPMAEMLRTGGAPAVREFRVPSPRRHAAAMVRVVLRALRDAGGEIVGGVELITWPTPQVSAASHKPAGVHAAGGSSLNSAAGRSILDASERQAIESVLHRCTWNQSEACRELGISRITLWRKMRKLGIRRS
jgi:PAS domain S-box-containing protein